MAFRFSLQSVLRLRRSQQRQQELLVQRASEQVNSAIAELCAIDAELAQLSTGCGIETRGAEVQFTQAQRQVLEERRRQTQFALTKACERHSELVAELRKIWQQREILEALRKREHETYLREQARHEQAIQDDLFLVRTRDRKPLPN
jgi:flagellar export protein FliJ